MGRDDWYRNRTWSKEIESAFDARLTRSRQLWSRFQYLTIQAGAVSLARPDVARALYRRALELPKIEAGWATRVHEHLGGLAFRLGEDAIAIAHWSDAVMTSSPSERTTRGIHTPEQKLGRLLWMVSRDYERDARELLGAASDPDWGPPEPAQNATGEDYETPEHAGDGVLVVCGDLDWLAPEDIPRIQQYDPRTLEAFDRRVLSRGVYNVLKPWFKHGRFELPGYVGTCVVRHHSGEWIPGDRLVDWKLRTSSGVHMIYALTWRALHSGMPLARLYEDLVA